jgi:hypothetical protein
MGNKKIQVGIRFGILSEKLSTQLKKQKLNFAPERIKVFEKEIDAIHQLRFGTCLLNESMTDRLFVKLNKAILKHLAQNN